MLASIGAGGTHHLVKVAVSTIARYSGNCWNQGVCLSLRASIIAWGRFGGPKCWPLLVNIVDMKGDLYELKFKSHRSLEGARGCQPWRQYAIVSKYLVIKLVFNIKREVVHSSNQIFSSHLPQMIWQGSPSIPLRTCQPCLLSSLTEKLSVREVNTVHPYYFRLSFIPAYEFIE